MARRSVVLVAATLHSGGAERQMVEMANYLADRGTDVTIVTWAGVAVADFYRLDERVHRTHLAGNGEGGRLGVAFSIWRTIRGLRALLIAERPDVVLSFITENNVFTIAASAGLPVRVVVAERAHPAFDTTVSWLWRSLRRLCYRRADAVIAQTGATAEWITRHCATAALVIPNALRALETVMAPREDLILAVGRLTRQKGFDLLLRAFAQVHKALPQWRLAILGDGPERAALLSMRDALSLGDRVSLPGVQRDIEQWMARAGLVVQPSRFEGFPNAVLEAMGCGAAVISADCPAGPADLIDDGRNGRLVPMEDVETLASVMRELLTDADARARLGRGALEVRERFSQDRIMTLWDAALFPRISATQVPA